MLEQVDLRKVFFVSGLFWFYY